ncbi:MAG: hypothetical protein Q9174_001424 [Haloplaca sp. 1 TL-2023]
MARQRLKYGSLLLSLTVAVSAECFLPNGTDRNLGLFDDDYFPFQTTSDGHSMCCNIHHDTPRSDGLCADLSLGIVWRESCTDPTWESPNCIKLCAAFEPTNFHKYPGTKMEDNDEVVTPCEDGSFCCGMGAEGTSCCRNKGGVFLVDGTTQASKPTKAVAPATLIQSSSSESAGYSFSTTLAVTSLSTALSSSTASATAPTATSTAVSAEQEVQEDSSGDSQANTGAIVGGVIGAVAALLLIAAALWFFVFRKRRRAQQPLGSEQGTPSLGYTSSEKRTPPLHEAHGVHSNGSELHGGPIDATAGRTEMANGYGGSELDAGSGDRTSRKVEMPG